MRLAHLVLGGLLICWTAAAPAAPHITGAKPEPFAVKPGKTLQQRVAEKHAGMNKAYIAPATYPTTISVLFLRVDFPPDTDATTTGTGDWTDPAYDSGGGPDFWVNNNQTKFRDYYLEASYGLLTANVTISPGVYRLPSAMASYSDSYPATGIMNLICDSVKAADTDSVNPINFLLYDAIVIVHAGTGEESDVNNDTAGDFWSLYYSASAITGTQCPSGLVADGKTITEAVIMPQTDSQDGITVDPLGVYVHEFGHWLGLPDLYQVCGSFVCPPWDGIGTWGLMGGGIYNKGADGISGSAPAHPEAWSKVYLGWVTPTVLSSASEGMQTLAAATNQQIIMLPASTTSTDQYFPVSAASTNQYFLLENRQQAGFDQGLPGSGVLIWFIDDGAVRANIAYNTVNGNVGRPGVSLRDADGNRSLQTWEGGCNNPPTSTTPCDDGHPGDPFPGTSNNTSLTPLIEPNKPNSKPYNGSGWVNINNISIDNVTKLASFYVGFGPPPPSSVNVTISGSSAAMSWTPTTATDIATYHVYQNGAKIAETTGTTYSLSGSASDSYQVLGVDTSGNVGDLSTAASITVSSGSGSGGGGGCFIATAAFGSYEAPAVQLLRDFRDEYLLTNAAGKRFVEFYYSTSPPIAATIADSEWLRALVRFLLLPWIALAWFFVQAGSVAEVVVVIMAVGVAFVLALLPKRNTSRGSL